MPDILQRPRPFAQVDVFTAHALRGNPVAVVLDAHDLSTEQMADFTHWTNLSEATFVLPPTAQGAAAGADYRVRIFCPGRELPFAGHPTLGTCHAWLAAGGVPRDPQRIVQECGVGLVPIRRETDAQGDRLAFAAPPLLRGGPLDEADVQQIAHGLRIPRSAIVAHQWCDNGPKWRAVMLADAAAVLALQPDVVALAQLDVGVIGPHPAPHADAGQVAWEVRAFFPGHGGVAVEDPVTGSLNAALGQWLLGSGRATSPYVAAQGTALKRAGRVHVQAQDGAVWVGGHSVTCIHGTLYIE
jgi:PhzF family phenazine biosynthesis protein